MTKSKKTKGAKSAGQKSVKKGKDKEKSKEGKTLKQVIYDTALVSPGASVAELVKAGQKAFPGRDIKETTLNSWRSSWGKGVGLPRGMSKSIPLPKKTEKKPVKKAKAAKKAKKG